MQGEEEANVHLLQTVWCRYAGQAFSQPTNIWSAVLSHLAEAQASNQQQSACTQQQYPVPSSTAQLSSQQSAPLISRDLVQSQLYGLQSASHQGATVNLDGQSLHSRADSLQDGDAYDRTAQQELAELLSAHHDVHTAAEHVHQPQDHSLHGGSAHQDGSHNWAPARAQTGPQDMAFKRMHVIGPLSHPPSPTAELSHHLSWSQHQQQDHLLFPDQQMQQPPSHLHQEPSYLHSQQRQHYHQQQQDDHQQQQHQQQQQVRQLASPPQPAVDHAGSVESTYPGGAYQEPVWHMDGLTESALNPIHSNSHQHDGFVSKSGEISHSFGLGQYAAEAAAVPSFQPHLEAQHLQHQVPQWHQLLPQQDSARTVRPRQNYSSSHAPVPSIFASASHPAREDSGDLSTSAGTQQFLARVYSAGPAFSGSHAVRDGLRPVAVASPKSSLGSSLPSLVTSLGQVHHSCCRIPFLHSILSSAVELWASQNAHTSCDQPCLSQ